MFYVVSYLVPVSLYQHLITSYFRKPINNWEKCPSLQFLLSVSFFIPLVPFSFLLAFYLFKSISAISLLLFDLPIKASICFHVFLFGFWARCLSHLIQFKKKKKSSWSFSLLIFFVEFNHLFSFVCFNLYQCIVNLILQNHPQSFHLCLVFNHFGVFCPFVICLFRISY